jgi:DNA polymerase-1
MASVLTPTDFENFVAVASGEENWCVDVETNGFSPYDGNQICGVGVAFTNRPETFYFPFRHQQGDNLDIDLLDPLIQLMSTRSALIGHNLKFDAHFLVSDGLDITGIKLIDTLVLCRLTESTTERTLGLTYMLTKRFGKEYGEYDIMTKATLRKNKWHKDFSLAPQDILGPYCEKDVESTVMLYKDCLRLVEASNQNDIMDMVVKLTKVLFRMENRGIRIDRRYAAQAVEAIQARRDKVEKMIYAFTGYEFNILSSTKQITLAMDSIGIKPTRITEKGNPSWNEEALVRTGSELGGLIAQYRNLSKLQSTYLEPYTGTDEMHSVFKNWGTVTGRLSSANPNLQNLPRDFSRILGNILTHDELEELRARLKKNKGAESDHWSDDILQAWSYIGGGKLKDDTTELTPRRLVIPRDDYRMVSFDYSQMEVRMFLLYVGQPEMIALMKKEKIDFHGEAAKIAFKVTEDDPEFSFYRQAAKTITFGVIYGIGKNKLAQDMGVSPQQAQQYKNTYFANMKGSRQFFDRVVKTIETRGWVRNKYGRIYKVPNNWGYKAVNYLVQGTSADILSERMINIDEFLQPYKTNMLMQIHDEIIFEVHKDEIHIVPDIKKIMLANSLNMDLEVDMEWCTPSWATKTDFYVDGDQMLEGKVPVAIDKPVDNVIDYIDWD